MSLFFESGVFSWDGTMPVWDRNGHIRYYVTGNGYRRRIHVRDLAGREAITLRQVVPSMLTKYDIEIYGRPAGTLIRHPGKPLYEIEGERWEIVGETGIGSFDILEDGTTLASCAVKGRNTELSCTGSQPELRMLAVALVLCCVLGPQETKQGKG